MKRDRRLQGLSSEHHQALVMARSASESAEAGTWGLPQGAALGARFDLEVEPHFRVEEEVLLPALREVGQGAVVAQTEADHAFLRAQLALARAGDVQAAAAFGERLREHVRFEERELFALCETCLPSSVLDETARRSPKRP